MKAKLEYCLRWLREGAVRVVRSYPVETLLALYACIRCLLTYELDWSEEELFNRLGLVPLFFALALAVNNLAGRGPWRKVYWVVWAPIVPLTLWSGLGDWIESASFRISLGILAPLLLLLSLRAVRNDRFVNGALVWLRSGALALLFANVALGLFYAILYSATYIFGLGGAWIEHVAVWSVTICETLAVPLLFLMMADRWRDAELRGSRILEMLLNYIVTPALLIYAAILYLYMAKILVTWTLPEGGVAYLVFGFTMTALAVAGRAAFYWLPQCKPVCAIVILTAVAFTPEAGFVTGAAAGLISNFFFGQGPWTPWQMLGFGLVGFLGGMLFAGRKVRLVPLLLYGFFSVLIVYGVLLDTASMLMYNAVPSWQLWLATCASGFVFNLIHAGATAVFLLLLYQPLLRKLARVKEKYGLLE